MYLLVPPQEGLVDLGVLLGNVGIEPLAYCLVENPLEVKRAEPSCQRPSGHFHLGQVDLHVYVHVCLMYMCACACDHPGTSTSDRLTWVWVMGDGCG